MFPALALIEVASIARGMVVSDRCVKKAPITLLASEPISPGRYITLFWGDVASVQEAHAEGVEVAGDSLVDSLFLPGAHEALLGRLLHKEIPAVVDSLAIVEVATVAATLVSSDAALKAADTALLELRLASGLGGKGYFVLTGPLCDVQASVEAAAHILKPDQLVGQEVIPRPDPDFTRFLT